MTEFIELPNGDFVRADTIFAVRIGEQFNSPIPGEPPIKARVFVDYGLRSSYPGDMDSHNISISYMDTLEECKAERARIMREIREALKGSQ